MEFSIVDSPIGIPPIYKVVKKVINFFQLFFWICQAPEPVCRRQLFSTFFLDLAGVDCFGGLTTFLLEYDFFPQSGLGRSRACLAWAGLAWARLGFAGLG